MVPGLLKQLGILLDLATADRAEPGHDVAGQTAAAHYKAEDLTFDLDYLVTRDVFGCDNHHAARFAVGRLRDLVFCNCHDGSPFQMISIRGVVVSGSGLPFSGLRV